MIAYKLKHIPTGLYYKLTENKCNLSKLGKLYSKPKTPKAIHVSFPWHGCDAFWNSEDGQVLKKWLGGVDKNTPYNLTIAAHDWKWVQVTVEEVEYQ